MITLEAVSKRYVVDRVPGKWILRNVSLVIPSRTSIAVLGDPGSGKSTLLRLISGADEPTTGRIKRNARIATPTKYQLNLQPLLSGRQNVKFICRINGYADDMPGRLAYVDQIARLGPKFDKPVNSYTPTMKSRLGFALSLAFDFDLYLSDGFKFAGEAGFIDKAAADAALAHISERSGLIMTARGAQAQAVLKRHCVAGIWLHEGRAQWFDSIDDAMQAQQSVQPARKQRQDEAQRADSLRPPAAVASE